MTPLANNRIGPNMVRIGLPLAVCTLFLLSRIVNLDADGPLYAETQYNSWHDSFIYSLRALTWYNAPYYTEYQDIYDQNIPLLYISNAITYLTMLIFGDNFYGYRLGVVLTSVATVALMYRVLYSVAGYFAAAIAAAYLILDYNFFVASREVEPTTFRIFELAVSIWLFSAIARHATKISGLAIFFLVFINFAMLLLEYPTSLFVPSALVATLVAVYVRSMTDLWVAAGASVLGLIAALLLYVAVTFLAGDSLAVISGMGVVWGPRVSGGASFIKQVTQNIANIHKALFLSYVPFMLYIFVAVLLMFWTKTSVELTRLWRSSGSPEQDRSEDWKKYTNLYVMMLSLFLLAQSVFINDYPVRKQVIWLPIFVYMASILLWDFANLVSRGRFNLLVAATVVPLALFASFSLPRIIDKAIIGPTFTHKAAMMSLRPYDGEYFIGAYSWGFTLYNRILPVGNLYIYTKASYPAEFTKPLLALVRGETPNPPRFTIARDDNRSFKKAGFVPELLLLAPREKTYEKVWLLKRDNPPVRRPAASPSTRSRRPL